MEKDAYLPLLEAPKHTQYSIRCTALCIMCLNEVDSMKYMDIT